MQSGRTLRGLLSLALMGCLAVSAAAQRSGQLPAVYDGAGLTQRLGEVVPGDLVFYDEQGEPVQLDAFLARGKPVLLTMVYHNCPMLCNLMLDAFTRTLQDMRWTPGNEFEVVTVSFAADETPDLARRQKERYVKQLGRPAAARGWHFLTGSDASIQALAQAVGFEFRWVEETQQYVHPTVLIFLNEEGVITRYIQGLEFPARDVRLALVETSAGRIADPIDLVALYCFQYDPEANSYVLHASNLMKIGGLLTVAVLALVLAFFWRRERERLERAAVSP